VANEIVANNGLEALEKVRKVSRTDGSASGQSFDCVIMDLEMPGTSLHLPRGYADVIVMDGLTAVKHIREEEKTGSLANNLVIALSKSHSLESQR
jgi:CheY-like chemotaxis protein